MQVCLLCKLHRLGASSNATPANIECLKMAPQPAMLTDQVIEAVNASEDLAAF